MDLEIDMENVKRKSTTIEINYNESTASRICLNNSYYLTRLIFNNTILRNKIELKIFKLSLALIFNLLIK